MFKIIALVKRKAGISKEAFFDHWEKVLGPLALGPNGPPGVRRYTQTHWMELADGSEADFDGVAEMWFDTAEAARGFFQFARAGLHNDQANVMDLEHTLVYLGEEKVIKA